MIACIVQARIKSTRLPAKTLLMLPTGITVIEEVLRRCLLIKGIDQVVAAIPDTPDCDWLCDLIAETFPHSVIIVRGSELDVLARYHQAARAVNADHIMRITADCPCLNPEVCGQVLDLHLQGGFDYTSNCWPRTYPVGFDCEVFTRDMLNWAHINNMGLAREHVTTMMSDRSKWRIGNLAQQTNESETLLTLDTIDDFVRICQWLKEHMLPCGDM